MNGWLGGKRALVVGAGSGIGRAVCAAFVEEGATVAGMEIDAAKCEALAAALPESIVVNGDATSLADNRHAVDAVVARYGGLDVLVHTVGVFDFYRGIRELTDDELDGAFDEMFGTNVRSPLSSVKAALPALEQQTGGNIVLDSLHLVLLPGAWRRAVPEQQVRRPWSRRRPRP